MGGTRSFKVQLTVLNNFLLHCIDRRPVGGAKNHLHVYVLSGFGGYNPETVLKAGNIL